MADTTVNEDRPGEAPDTLHWIQIALAHVLLAGGVAWLVLLYQPTSDAARWTLLAAGGLGLFLALVRGLSWGSLGMPQKVSAVATLAVSAAFLALGGAAGG